MQASESLTPTEVKKKTYWTLFLVIAACAAPVILSYLTYYVIKPQARNNYGDLIDPRAYPIPDLGSVNLEGQPASLEQLRGKWILLQVDSAACEAACQQKLYYMRQLRLTQGKEMERIERVWLITDDAPLDIGLMKQYDGTHFLRVDPKKLAAWLPVVESTQGTQGTKSTQSTQAIQATQATQASDHLYMIDPLGNLMMRFPKDPDANKIKKDITRLLKASGIG